MPLALRDYRLLALFAAVAEAGAIRGAARKLRVSAPVVSQALKEIEAILDLSLRRREGRRLILTEAGRTLAGAAADMVRAAERGFATARGGDGARGTVAITVVTEICAFWLPPQLKALEARYPELRVVIEASEAVVDLERSDRDLAIRATYTRAASAPADALDVLPLALVAAPARARAFHAAPARRPLPFLGLMQPVEDGVLRAVTRSGRERRVPVSVHMALDNQLVAKELTKQGFGAGLFIRTAVAKELASGALIELLPGLDFGRVVLRAHVRDRLPSAATRAVLAFLSGRPDRRGA